VNLKNLLFFVLLLALFVVPVGAEVLVYDSGKPVDPLQSTIRVVVRPRGQLLDEGVCISNLFGEGNGQKIWMQSNDKDIVFYVLMTSAKSSQVVSSPVLNAFSIGALSNGRLSPNKQRMFSLGEYVSLSVSPSHVGPGMRFFLCKDGKEIGVLVIGGTGTSSHDFLWYVGARSDRPTVDPGEYYLVLRVAGKAVGNCEKFLVTASKHETRH